MRFAYSVFIESDTDVYPKEQQERLRSLWQVAAGIFRAAGWRVSVNRDVTGVNSGTEVIVEDVASSSPKQAG